MIVIHGDNDFSVTNLFQFDYDLKLLEGSAKKIEVIRNIKKLFNFDSNKFVTLNKGDKVQVICIRNGNQKAYECEVLNPEKVTIIKELDININDTLKKLKNGKCTTR